MQSAAAKDSQAKRAAERAAYVEHRRLARERLAALRAKLKDAIAARNAKRKEIVAACRSERRAVREQIKAMRAEGRRAIRARADAERQRVRTQCAAEKARAKEECDTAIARARAELAAERKRKDAEQRIERQEQADHDALKRAHDTGAAHLGMRMAMLGAFGPLYDRVRPRAGESRPEAILRYAETHPEEAHAVLHPAAERAIAETKAQIAAVERAAAAPTPIDLEEAHRRRRARTRRAGETPAAPVRKKGELARQGGGMLVEDLLRERDELAAEKALNKDAKTRGRLRLVVGGAAAAAPVYGVRWTTEGSGRAGWVLRSGDGSPAWTGTREEADDRARKMTATSRTNTTYSAAPFPDGAGVTERVRALGEGSHGFVKHEGTPFGEAEGRASKESHHERAVKAPELRDTALIAKRIRADIADALKRKELPKAKYSVRTSKYSMGSSIDVDATKLPFPVINPDAFVVDPGANYVRFDGARYRSRLTPEAQAVEKTLQAIVDAYNWDRSDYATDYVNVRFHGHVNVNEDPAVWKRMEAEKVAAARRSGA